MKKKIRRIFGTGLLLGMSGVILHFFCYRGPTVTELQQRYRVAPVTTVAVDVEQGDIGFFGITTHAPAGRETFWMETSPQWIWPWQSYPWRNQGN